MNYISKIYHSSTFRKYSTVWFLIGISLLFFLLRLPSLIEPNWYGDEGIYQVVGRAIHNGALLYRDTWDNKPPLLYFLYALVNGDLFLVKFASFAAGLMSAITFFFISKKIFKGNIPYAITTLYAILFGTPLLEGNIANAENFMQLPTLLALYCLIVYTKTKKMNLIIISGLLLSIAFLFKIVAVFDFFAFLTFLFFLSWDGLYSKSRIFLSRLYPSAIFTLCFLSLFIVSLLYFFSKGAFVPFYRAVFGENIAYVGTQNSLVFPMGILIIKSLLLVGALLLLFAKRKNFSMWSLLIYIWFIFSLYNSFFSHRAYTHYLLVLLPAFCLLIGHMVSNLRTRIADVILVVGVIAFATMHFSLYKYTYPYYKNYIEFITGKNDITAYQLFFDRNTPRDYEIASFIKLNSVNNEKIFLWSDSAQVYALSNTQPIGKYVVAYHMTFYKDGIDEAKRNIEIYKPRFIIQTADYPEIKNFLSSYDLRYRIQGVTIYEREI